MKKVIISVIAVILVIASLSMIFVGCNKKSKATDVKSSLEKAGYAVTEYSKDSFESANIINDLETSKMDGLDAVFYAKKTTDAGEDHIVILVFSNAEKAGQLSDDDNITLGAWGRNHASDPNAYYFGQSNNIVWAGSDTARADAGLTA